MVSLSEGGPRQGGEVSTPLPLPLRALDGTYIAVDETFRMDRGPGNSPESVVDEARRRASAQGVGAAPGGGRNATDAQEGGDAVDTDFSRRVQRIQRQRRWWDE